MCMRKSHCSTPITRCCAWTTSFARRTSATSRKTSTNFSFPTSSIRSSPMRPARRSTSSIQRRSDPRTDTPPDSRPPAGTSSATIGPRTNSRAAFLDTDLEIELHQIACDHDVPTVVLAYALGPHLVGDRGVVAGNEMAQYELVDAGLLRDPPDVFRRGMRSQEVRLQGRRVLDPGRQSVYAGHIKRLVNE